MIDAIPPSIETLEGAPPTQEGRLLPAIIEWPTVVKEALARYGDRPLIGYIGTVSKRAGFGK